MAQQLRKKTICGFVPPLILDKIQSSQTVNEASRIACRATLKHRAAYIEKRASAVQLAERHDHRQQVLAAAVPKTPSPVKRKIFDSKETADLPGTLARSEGDARAQSRQVNNCYDGFKITHDFFSMVFGRNSIDGKGLALQGSVHFNPNPETAGYNNAFWDGEENIMVFGSGDHITFDYFTDSLDVIAHELSHGFVQYSSPLEYEWQSGALNESCADVFACMIEQWHMRQSVENADWIIGQTLFPVAFTGVGLRTCKEGPAYKDDPILDTDIQPKHMRNLYTGPEDGRGVHINSGIPNHAFYLAAKELGGNSWEKAGKVWYKTMLSGKIPPTCEFVTFANVTVEIAGKEFADGSVKKAVRDAWVKVGVLKAAA